MEDEPDLALEPCGTRSRMSLFRCGLRAARQFSEGPGYWTYGTTYNVLLVAELESALGSDFGLS